MAVPSSLYAEDENARQTLANGTVLKWTKTNSEIYALPNVETDRSICYCNWRGELDYANRGFHQWQGGCVTGEDLGHNGCEGSGFENLHANSLKQIEFGQPRMDGLYTGVVLTDSDGDGFYVWGYNPETSACLNGGNGGSRRYLLDMDINKMIFNITVNVYDKADFDAIDYLNSNNPESYQLPSQHNITLKQLYENPNDYYVDSFNWGSTYVYGEDTSDHWRSTNIRPAHIISGETVGQFKGTRNLGIFGMHYASGNFSYDNSNPMNPNAHPNFGGGGSTPVIYNNMNNGYFMACGREIDLNPVYSYTAVGTSAESIAQYKWGTASSWNHNAYVNQEFFDYGGSVIWCAYGAHAYYNSNTSESKYKEYLFFTRKMLKGQYALDYIASFGLYFASETFDPDSVNLTPETLGDDSRIMLGEMSADGTTTGRWITDIDSYTGPNKDGKTSNPDYDPSGGGGGGGGYDDDPWHGVSFSGVQVGGIGAFARCYYMTSTELQNLRSWMASTSVPEGFDPMAQIIGLSQVPVALSGDDSENIQFINSSAVYDPGVTSRVVDSGVSSQYSMGVPKRYSLGSVNITRRMQERGEPYLDYSCQVELYLPLVGVFSLDTQAIMGRTISAEAILDPVSGTLAAYAWVEKDGQKLPIAYGSTTIGVDLPVTAQQYSVAKAALKQANAQLGTSLLSSALTMIASASASGKAASGGGRSGASVSSGIQPANNYNPYSQAASLAASQTMLSQTGNVFGSFMEWGRTIRQLSYGNNTAIAGSFGGTTAQWSYPFEAYVKIIRPRYEKPSNYNHSQGVPCVKSMKVGSCTGLIQCIGADVSGITRATDLERQAIQAALTNGVFAGGGQS